MKQVTRSEDILIIGYDAAKAQGCFEIGSIITADAWSYVFPFENPYADIEEEVNHAFESPIVLVAIINQTGWKCYWGSTKMMPEQISMHGSKFDVEDVARSYFPFLHEMEFEV